MSLVVIDAGKLLAAEGQPAEACQERRFQESSSLHSCGFTIACPSLPDVADTRRDAFEPGTLLSVAANS